MPGVYLSYPFCAQKCTYCNFASGVFPRDLEPRYLDALRREISAHSWQWQPETIYLGGGTPSSMLPDALRSLLELIPGRPWLEATLEAAPGNITPEKARAWVEAGITRVSLGVQSFVDAEIRRTGRKHSAAMVAEEIRVLRNAGVADINIDLIAGLSAQTEASWRESLEWIERLAPEHVSVYMLEIDEDSRLGKEMLLGGVRYGAADTPSEDQTAAFYEIAVVSLAELGIPRYEISNFARPGHESRHNLKYWTLSPYIGFGADAHSFDGAERWSNPESPEEYATATLPNGRGSDDLTSEPRPLGSVRSDDLTSEPRPLGSVGLDDLTSEPRPSGSVRSDDLTSEPRPLGSVGSDDLTSEPRPSGSVRLDDLTSEPRPLGSVGSDDLTSEPRPLGSVRSDDRMMLGLRLSAGIRPTAQEWELYSEPIARFLDYGLLESHDGALRLTDRGVLLSNEVFQEFVTT